MRVHAVAAAIASFPCLLIAASCTQPTDGLGPMATPDAEPGTLWLMPSDDGAIGEAQEDLSILKIVRCTGNELGAACERKCDAAGLWCPALFEHPYKPDAGNGELFQCRGALGIQSCWYYYESNQDKCIRATLGSRRLTLCSYEGERP